MERHKIIDKLDELYEKADKNNIGLNETELEYKELIADWIENIVNKLAIDDVGLPTDKEGTLPDRKFKKWNISRGDGDAIQNAV